MLRLRMAQAMMPDRKPDEKPAQLNKETFKRKCGHI